MKETLGTDLAWKKEGKVYEINNIPIEFKSYYDEDIVVSSNPFY